MREYTSEEKTNWRGIPLLVRFDFYMDDESMDVGSITVLDDTGVEVDEISDYLSEWAIKEISTQLIAKWRKDYIEEDEKGYYKNRNRYDREWRMDHGAYS